MLIKTKKSLIVILAVIIIICISPTTAMAMTPGPHLMNIVVINAPEDLRINIVHDDYYGEYFRTHVSSRLWETYYRFRLDEGSASSWPYEDITIFVNSKKYDGFELTFPVPRGNFSLKIDLDTQTITQPYSHGRNLIIVLCWLIPLFVLDSIVFLLFGHRKERSWKIFALVNLAMQGLFIGVWSLYNIVFPDVFLLLMFLFIPLLLIPMARVAKFTVEVIIFRYKIGEKSKTRATVCAVVMNLIGTFSVILLGINLPLPAL